MSAHPVVSLTFLAAGFLFLWMSLYRFHVKGRDRVISRQARDIDAKDDLIGKLRANIARIKSQHEFEISEWETNHNVLRALIESKTEVIKQRNGRVVQLETMNQIIALKLSRLERQLNAKTVQCEELKGIVEDREARITRLDAELSRMIASQDGIASDRDKAFLEWLTKVGVRLSNASGEIIDILDVMNDETEHLMEFRGRSPEQLIYEPDPDHENMHVSRDADDMISGDGFYPDIDGR